MRSSFLLDRLPVRVRLEQVPDEGAGGETPSAPQPVISVIPADVPAPADPVPIHSPDDVSDVDFSRASENGVTPPPSMGMARALNNQPAVLRMEENDSRPLAGAPVVPSSVESGDKASGDAGAATVQPLRPVSSVGLRGAGATARSSREEIVEKASQHVVSGPKAKATGAGHVIMVVVIVAVVLLVGVGAFVFLRRRKT